MVVSVVVVVVAVVVVVVVVVVIVVVVVEVVVVVVMFPHSLVPQIQPSPIVSSVQSELALAKHQPLRMPRLQASHSGTEAHRSAHS